MLSQNRPAGSDTFTFLGAIMRNPHQLGAIAPSSKAVARLAASIVPTTPGATVVELGAGGGVISDAIRDRLPVGGRQLAIELNEDMVSHLRRSRPWLEVISGDAGDLGKLLREAGLSHADAIVSSLPWTLFEEAQQKRVLEEIAACLAPGGAFSTITTLTVMPFQRSRHFRGLMNSTFANVATLGPIWRNVPPALVYAGTTADDRLTGEAAGGLAAGESGG